MRLVRVAREDISEMPHYVMYSEDSVHPQCIGSAGPPPHPAAQPTPHRRFSARALTWRPGGRPWGRRRPA